MLLEIKDLRVTRGGQGDPEGAVALGRTPAKCTPSWGRTARARARSRACWPAIPATRSPAARSPTTARTCSSMAARGARLRGRVHGVPVPGRDSRHQQHATSSRPRSTRCASTAASRSSTPSSSCSSSAEKAKLLEMDQAMLNRSVNEGFSGGEKKRNEIFQMAVLEPRLAILDETDSGLDIDALQDRRERRQRAAQPRPRDRRRHALPAAAQLHRARLRARADRRPHRPIGRQGAGARARGEGLRLDRDRPAGAKA